MTIYAEPKDVQSMEDCIFYHAIDIPNYGVTKGQWDLRDTYREYLGNVDFRGKSVLELGTASGFLCFQMEKMGADVVAYDLSPNDSWDLLLSPDDDEERIRTIMKRGIERYNNAFWFCHNLFNSNARLAHGTLYDIPNEIGKVDVVTLCSVLLHLRDPILALQRAASFAKETVIITEQMPNIFRFMKLLPVWVSYRLNKVIGPYAQFIPTPETKSLHGGLSWWHLTPDILKTVLQILGFQTFQLTTSKHLYSEKNRRIGLYTLVAKR
jgi:hypothetical protein